MSALSLDELFHESNFHSISSLTSIYGATQIIEPGGRKKLLIAMLKGKITSYEYKKSGDSLTKLDKEISFTYIPADANVVSIDSFSCKARGLIIAVAFYKETNGKLTNFLNIYCNYSYDATDENKSCELETVAENCRTFELHFIPFQLTHCISRPKDASRNGRLLENVRNMGSADPLLLIARQHFFLHFVVHHSLTKCDSPQTVFLLLGGDCQIHVFSQHQTLGEFSEQNLNNYFPELCGLPGVPLYLDIKVVEDGTKRVAAVGHQTGDVLLLVTDLSTDDWSISASWQIQHDSPITCVRLFTKYTDEEMPKFMRKRFTPVDGTRKDQSTYHLLVASAWEDAMVYCQCVENGFDAPVVLEKSSEYDCVTCCTISDIDRDGENDIVIGTYGQEILIYKFGKLQLTVNDEEKPREPLILPPTWNRSFSYPVIKIILLDLTRDGLDEMAVITAKGLHALQCNPKSTLQECKRKLLKLRQFKKPGISNS